MKLLRPRPRGGTWRIVILVRRIDVAVAASVLLHLVLFALPGPPAKPPEPPGQAPLQVVIAKPAEVRVPEPLSSPPQPVERPTVKPVPRPSAPRITQPTPKATPEPVAQDPVPAPQPTPAPPMDMLATLEARRAQRRAQEGARAGPSTGQPAEDAATRNLRSLTGGEGVGGVFEILQKGVRTGQFAFNGWKPDARSKWREVIEVDAGAGGDLERAMVRRMIELIRTHYTGDFRWDSRRLGRVVTLSAKPEDQSGLEDFMMKEFFSTPRRG